MRLWMLERRVPADIAARHAQGDNAYHPESQSCAKLTLLIADGFISCLEASSDKGCWPRDEADFVLAS